MKSILIGFLFVNMVNSRAQPTEMIIEEFNKLIKTCKQAAIPGSFECSGNQKPNFYPQNACSDLMPEMRWPEYWPSHSPTPKSYETLCNGFDSGNKFSFFGCYVCSEMITDSEGGPPLPIVSSPVSGVDLKIDTTCKDGLTKLVPDFDDVKCTNEKP